MSKKAKGSLDIDDWADHGSYDFALEKTNSK
jgi:hypothetical protein